MKYGELVTVLDCTPITSEGEATDGPVLSICFERHGGEIETIAMTMRDCQMVLTGIYTVWTRGQTGGQGPLEGSGEQQTEKTPNDSPYDHWLARLRIAPVVTISVFYHGAIHACDVLGGYRTRPAGALFCLIRNLSYEPPRHFVLRIGLAKLDTGNTVLGDDDKEAWARWSWPCFLRMRANQRIVLRNKARGRKLGPTELKRLVADWQRS